MVPIGNVDVCDVLFISLVFVLICFTCVKFVDSYWKVGEIEKFVYYWENKRLWDFALLNTNLLIF